MYISQYVFRVGSIDVRERLKNFQITKVCILVEKICKNIKGSEAHRISLVIVDLLLWF